MPRTLNELPIDSLRDRLVYEPDTGVVRWIRTGYSNRFGGKEAGLICEDGYRTICIDYVPYAAHRIAWALHHGAWPVEQLDHINGVRADNRIANLRPATSAQNQHNKGVQRNNTSGFKGVSFHKHDKRYEARIRVRGVVFRLGRFKTAEEAAAAYQAAAKLHHGDFARHG